MIGIILPLLIFYGLKYNILTIKYHFFSCSFATTAKVDCDGEIVFYAGYIMMALAKVSL